MSPLSEGRGARKTLRALLETGTPVTVPLAFDPLSARLAELAGAQAVFMSGFGVSTTMALPDLGVLTRTEMVAAAARIVRILNAPLIVDADDGYGSADAVRETVREFEAAGVAGLQIEDQPYPKRSGLLKGKTVLPLREAAQKIAAAVAARSDPNLLIIARTDAMESHGLEDALGRAHAFAAEGCDMVLITELPGREGLRRYAEELVNTPKVYLGPRLTNDDLVAHGINLQLWGAAMQPAWRAYYEAVLSGLRGLTLDTEFSKILERATRLASYDRRQ